MFVGVVSGTHSVNDVRVEPGDLLHDQIGVAGDVPPVVYLGAIARQDPRDLAGDHLQRLALDVAQLVPVLAALHGVLQLLRLGCRRQERAVGLLAFNK